MAARQNRFTIGRFNSTLSTLNETNSNRTIVDSSRDTVNDIPEDGVNGVVKVNTNTFLNKLDHRTDDYENPYLIVRRGRTFIIDINLKSAYKSEKDDIRLVFQFGKNPLISKGTEIELHLRDEEGCKGWKTTVAPKGNSIEVSVAAPPNCYVGKWTLKIDHVIMAEESEKVLRYKQEPKIYILFNPWCKDDDVYLEEEDKRQEYVLNDSGKICIGSRGYGKPWVFGQFEDVILDCALYLLDDLSNMRDTVRGNPINVCRKLSALVNINDDSGVLVGNWSGDYEDGTSPLAWTGSVKILEEYFKSRSPVSFGQCWVFSGLVTTLCRTLGIPVRSVTNVGSAHDTDCSMTIDKFLDEDGSPISYMNGDSVWNFHVWNDVWMRRSDLPTRDYDGWQAIDATPQETSDGVHQMGPMPLKAIKEGNVTIPYDGQFVFAEVNGDKITWKKCANGLMKEISRDRNAVGQFIFTKAVGSDATDDITLEYKHPETGKHNWTADEIARRHAVLPENGKNADETINEEIRDVDFNVVLPEEIYVGSTLTVKLELKNNSKEYRKLKGKVHVSSVFYTGIFHRNIKSFSLKSVALMPKEEKKLSVEISADEYFKHLADFCQLHVTTAAFVVETEQSFVKYDTVTLEKPKLSIKAQKTCVKGSSVDVEVSFTNPLDMPMTACELAVEGPGLQKTLTLPQKNVPGKGTFVGKFCITPRKLGKRELFVIFNSDQLLSINACHKITVTEEKEEKKRMT